MARQGPHERRRPLLHSGPRPGRRAAPRRQGGHPRRQPVRGHARRTRAQNGTRVERVGDYTVQGGGLRREEQEDGLLRSGSQGGF